MQNSSAFNYTPLLTKFVEYGFRGSLLIVANCSYSNNFFLRRIKTMNDKWNIISVRTLLAMLSGNSGLVYPSLVRVL